MNGFGDVEEGEEVDEEKEESRWIEPQKLLKRSTSVPRDRMLGPICEGSIAEKLRLIESVQKWSLVAPPG